MTKLADQHDVASGYTGGEHAAEHAICAVSDGFAPPDWLLHDLLDVLSEYGQYIELTPRAARLDPPPREVRRDPREAARALPYKPRPRMSGIGQVRSTARLTA